MRSVVLLAVLAVAGTASADVIISQDFDAAGTGYGILTKNSNFMPAVRDAGPSGNWLELARLGVNDTNNRIQFGTTVAGGSYDKVTANFGFRAWGYDDWTADGFALVLLNRVHHTDMPVLEWEHQSPTGSLSLAFDDYEGSDPDYRRVRVLWDGSTIAEMTPSRILQKRSAAGQSAGDAFNQVSMTVDYVTGGASVSASLTWADGTPEPLFSSILVPTAAPYDAQVAFGTRTGGLANGVHLDNINVAFTSVPEPVCLSLLGLSALLLVRRRG